MSARKNNNHYDPLYRELILDHWQHPQNYGVIRNADFDVRDSNPICGDEIRLTGKIHNGKLTEIAFISDGCAISKVSASLFIEEIKGKSWESITKKTDTEVLGLLRIMSLTPARIKCALLVLQTLRKVQLRV